MSPNDGRYHVNPATDGRTVVWQAHGADILEYESTTRVIDVATGEESVIQTAAPGTALGPTAVTGSHVYWLLDEIGQNGTTALRRAGLDGSGVTDLSPETGPGALNVAALTVSEEAVTVVARTPSAELRNESPAKLRQFAPRGGGDDMVRSRVSCNRGEQLSAAAAAGTQVLWLDGTTGISNVVIRTRPTGTCA
ncbi:hypothetical protein [Streptomyces acidicola]|uniref:hypothetical protein n=1 Tax=Streptomyces acidicola TaxID=2596892 RepID=UPI00188449D5|nr:hypothetical protein [Streptomyces acidicola]